MPGPGIAIEFSSYKWARGRAAWFLSRLTGSPRACGLSRTMVSPVLRFVLVTTLADDLAPCQIGDVAGVSSTFRSRIPRDTRRATPWTRPSSLGPAHRSVVVMTPFKHGSEQNVKRFLKVACLPGTMLLPVTGIRPTGPPARRSALGSSARARQLGTSSTGSALGARPQERAPRAPTRAQARL